MHDWILQCSEWTGSFVYGVMTNAKIKVEVPVTVGDAKLGRSVSKLFSLVPSSAVTRVWVTYQEGMVSCSKTPLVPDMSVCGNWIKTRLN